jgi:hypothetical protein
MLERTPRDRRKRRLSLYGVLAAFIVISAASIPLVEGDVPQKEERMKKMCLVLCLVCLVSSVVLAQGKTNVQWKCDKPSVQHSIPVGDKPGHAYAIEQINCTPLKATSPETR